MVKAPTKMCDTISPDRDFCRKATSKQKRIAYVTTQQRYDSVYRNFGWYRERYASFAPIVWAGRFLLPGVPGEEKLRWGGNEGEINVIQTGREGFKL